MSQQRDGFGVDLRVDVKPDGAIAVPGPQRVGLVLGLGVAPEALHHQVLAVSGCWCHPRCAASGLERLPDAN